MMASLPGVNLAIPNQRELDWLLGNGVSTKALVRPRGDAGRHRRGRS
jgi:pyridoxal/pyridoxine/pyridoxamine kinase